MNYKMIDELILPNGDIMQTLHYDNGDIETYVITTDGREYLEFEYFTFVPSIN